MSPSSGWAALLGRSELWAGGVVVAAVFGLVWILRGAPLGLPVREAPTVSGPTPGRRDALAFLASIGLVSIAAGGWIAPWYGIPWSIPAFVSGFVLLARCASQAGRYRHDSPILRRVARFSQGAATASGLAGLLVVLNVAAYRYGSTPLDLTAERIHTLEPETIRLIRSLDRPVRFVAFYYGRMPEAAKQVERVRQLLSLLAAEDRDRVSVDYVNLHGDPARADSFLQKYPAAAVASGGVVVELGSGEAADSQVVRNPEMFVVPAGPSPGGPQETSIDFRGEYALSAALLRLRSGEKPKILITKGHGELSIDELDPRRPGVGLLRARLADVGFSPVELDLREAEVPEDASIVLSINPKTPFSSEEAGRLGAFLEAGGRAILLLDGRVPTGLEDLLRRHNLTLGSALVVEPESRFSPPSPTVPVRIPDGAEHPILRPLAGQTAYLASSTPLTLLNASRPGEDGPQRDVVAEELLSTSPFAWGETKPDVAPVTLDPGSDIAGPIVVGAAVSSARSPGGPPDPERPRLVMFSSGSLADNRLIRAVGSETNLELVVNAANWLRGQPDIPPIAPRTRTLPRLNPDRSVQARLIVMPTLISVSLILGLGAAVYVARRA